MGLGGGGSWCGGRCGVVGCLCSNVCSVRSVCSGACSRAAACVCGVSSSTCSGVCNRTGCRPCTWPCPPSGLAHLQVCGERLFIRAKGRSVVCGVVAKPCIDRAQCVSCCLASFLCQLAKALRNQARIAAALQDVGGSACGHVSC